MSAPPTTDTRSLTVHWSDPLASLAQARELSGLEAVRAIQDGTIPPPPIAMLLGMAIVEVRDGDATFEVLPGEQHYNPIGVVHGGLAATLLDSAMGCAVQSTLPAGVAYTTLELKVNYVRAMTRETGLVQARGTIIHRGARVATAEGRVTDADGRLLAHATTTCMILGVTS